MEQARSARAGDKQVAREANDDGLGMDPGGGGWYCHIWAIWVGAAVNGMVFKQFTLG